MIKTKIVHRPKLNFWERIYFPEVFRGVLLTSRHFFKNLTLHIFHSVGLFRKFAAMVTIQYPEETWKLPARLRTRHRLTKREDGSPRCVACMMCETVCPARCIYIVAEEHPDPNIEKRPKSFVIDLGKCVYCGFCVEACPEDAIRMDTKIIDTAAYSREGMILDMNELLNPSMGLPRKLDLK
ncbi:MAG: NADH-quinone oxidoreductase subunit I [Candidatus Omnitrophica bacterium]|nr:NADH-quinone oxidoreductase subunit I [Candidatus Omnitrophota bacterium]